MKNTKSREIRESGFASIVIALVLVIVLGLLTVAFAQLARREQKNTLDKQLAAQAYYAAESGVNDAIKAIPLIQQTPPASTTACLTPAEITAYQMDSKVNQPNAVSYSCISVNVQPPNLVYSGVGPGADKNTTFTTNGSLRDFTIYWASADNKTTPRASGGFAPRGSWNSPGVLQVSVTPLTAVDRNSLIANTFTAYLYPGSGTGTVTYDVTTPASQAPIIGGNCNAAGDYPCKVTITGLPNVSGIKYLVRILNYYDESNITIGDPHDYVGGAALKFIDGQAQIDVTGKAQDVLKRIQVRAPIKQPGQIPPYAAEGQNICKRFSTGPGIDSFDTTLPGCDPFSNP